MRRCSSALFFTEPPPTETYTLSLHDALPISNVRWIYERFHRAVISAGVRGRNGEVRSEEHTSELQSRPHLVCRLLLEKKKTAERRRLRLTRRAEGMRVGAVPTADRDHWL